MESTLVLASIELLTEVLRYAAPAAFVWLLVGKGARAIIRAATGRSIGGV